jgi:tetratricopeptide (TPR) repeat protein
VTAPKKDILQGWKDIAAYVARDVRTVKRWEKQRGLPVRRMPGPGRTNVYALISDLDNWLSSTGPIEAEADSQAGFNDADDPETDADPISPPDEPPVQSLDQLPVSNTAQTDTAQLHPGRARRWAYVAVGVLCIAAIATVAALHARRHSQTVADLPPFDPTQTVRTVKYSSKVSGVDALYLRGIYFSEQRTPDTLDRALKCFQQAVDQDPGYAPAYAGLAQTYNLIREYSMMPDAEAYANAKIAAQRAISLDPNLSEAHASLGFVEFFWDWNAPGAEREFQTAIALDPNSALAHHWYGSMLTHEGRYNESLAQLDFAQRLQPTSTSILSDRAFALGLSGHRNEAADILQEVENDDPSSPSPHRILSSISLVEPRDIPRYLDEMRRFDTLRHNTAHMRLLDEMDRAYRTGGAPAMWRAELAEEERRHPSPGDRTYSMAVAEAALGEKDASLHDLEQLAARRDPTVMGIEIDPVIASVRGDPRFARIVATVGLPPGH